MTDLNTLFQILIWVSCIVGFVLLSGWWMNGYFRRRGVKSPTAYIPFVGHMFSTLSQQQHFKDFFQDLYTMYPNERYIGVLQFTKPMVVLRDVELLKQLTIKDFDHFLDHVFSIERETDHLFGGNLFSLKGQEWRDMRATLSPAFTSSKMRGMFQFVVDCGEQMANYFGKQMEIKENKIRGLIEIEIKDAFTRYTNDVIATTAFGLKVNSFLERDNQFYLNGKETSNFGGKQFLKFLFLIFMPAFAKVMDIQFLTKRLSNFYRNIVWDTINDREKRNIIRNDMIQLLMEARKGTLKHDTHQEDGKDTGFATVEESAVGKTTVKREWSDDDIVAQAVLFFVAGFDTSATLLSFLAHELALNPNIQRRLQEEIDEVAAGLDGKLTYDCLQKMKYLDMVVSETLRMWPLAIFLDRKCVKQYTLPPPNKDGEEFQLRVGDGIWIPVYSFHHDPKNFENPEVFDPERFSDENKHNIKPFTYLPFGIGPRNCIGSRFALMEAKAAVFNLLLKFDIVTTAKTQNPIKLKLVTSNLLPEKGFWVGLKPREQK